MAATNQKDDEKRHEHQMQSVKRSNHSSAEGAESSVPESHYPWDVPEYNKIARFFASLSESKIETTKCTLCNTIQWPPRSICSNCLCTDLDWIEIPKTGTVVGFSKAYVGTNPGEEPPMLVAAVHLDGEGALRLLTRISKAKFEDMKVGMKVKFARAALVNGKPYWEHEPLTN
ncbi:MAG TPA: OB-fold domain-containing protein [Nitrososphaerales archaeon]|nr:OB-fold domain-containing protein [Nitrososphaerales archaeon]